MKNADLPSVMLAGIERLAGQGKPVPPEMRDAFERQTGRKLQAAQPAAANALKEQAPPSAAVVPAKASVIPAQANTTVSVGTVKIKSDKGLFTAISDAELEALAAVTDGMEVVSGVAVILGIRRALRVAFTRGASTAPYGPAVLVRETSRI